MTGRDAAAPAAAVQGADAGPSERALTALKPFARIAWEECREPLPDSAGSGRTRWEIHSTWTLLLCLHHTEAEAERCWRADWRPQAWETEAQALRHLFLQSRSLRLLSALLRWLRWAHSWGPEGNASDDRGLGGKAEATAGGEQAGYERTRRALQLKGVLSEPLQDGPAMHPDGPLQQPGRFDEADLADEARLLRRLLRGLRRGDLRGAMQACADAGQPWRVALLQGMFPYAEGATAGEAEAGYQAMDDDEEDVLAAVKEEHTDWIEIGTLEHPGCSNGNPWRRLWKERCWDAAQRNSKSSTSTMSLQELAIYGFCAGHREALIPACRGSWADRLWADLHCLKEWLVEALLDAGRGAHCDEDVFLGEGDCGCPDPSETDETRAARRTKLLGHLAGVDTADLDAVVAREIRRIIVPLISEDLDEGPSFTALQSTIIGAALAPERGGEVLAMLRSWLGDGAAGDPAAAPAAPFVVKQFASHFAIWQKEALEHAIAPPPAEGAGPGLAAEGEAAPDAEMVTGPALDVDAIVGELVRDLVAAASGSWKAQCVEGHAVELIAEHVAALSPERRIEAFASLLLQLGSRSEFDEEAMALELRLEALKRCLWVFWDRFPTDACALLATLVRRALHLDDAGSEELELHNIGPCGVRSAVATPDVSVTLLCVMTFWVVARDKADAGEALDQALAGLEGVLGTAVEPSSRPGSGDEFARLLLDALVLPCLVDSLLSLSAADPARAAAALTVLQGSALWRDAASVRSPGLRSVTELEWFLGLVQGQAAWAEAAQEEQACRAAGATSRGGVGSGSRLLGPAPPQQVPAASAAEQERAAARAALLDWARPRLAQDRPLLEPPLRAHTTLTVDQWGRLSSTLACRSLLILLSVFEADGDFDGALQDLAVAAAQSPWLLRTLAPHHARTFLGRLAAVPMRLQHEQLCAPVGG